MSKKDKSHEKGVAYLNRELSWLDFNRRVLYQTIRPSTPLLERLNFLSITQSNLDEFVMVRFSSVINKLGLKTRDLSGMTPVEEYNAVLDGIIDFKDSQVECFKTLNKELKRSGIKFKNHDELTKKEVKELGVSFGKYVYPLLTPRTLNTTTEYPELDSKQPTIAVLLEDDDTQVISFIPLDPSLKKIYPLNPDGTEYILLEELIYSQLSVIFYKKKIIDYGMIKILREADIELDHNRDVYITERMKTNLLKRRYSRPIYMDCGHTVSKPFAKLLTKVFGLNKHHVYRSASRIDFTPYTELTHDESARYKPFTPQFPSELIGDDDMFEAINKNDILLHHPYESYDPVIRFVEQAAQDPNVISIKQTLYRVSSIDSPIVNALCAAARNGKQVSIILEIKARFDEARNISIIDKLKAAGCHLVYGVEHLKVHCKFISVVRREGPSIKIYTHIGTGNYNEKTSKLYTDISYFTANFDVGNDITTIFNMISGFSEPTTNMSTLRFSPYNLKSKILDDIRKETQCAKKGDSALIIMKMNSLCDKEIIDALYDAARNGVKITIFCRGVCSMHPVQNISIRSLIGRFLEHSRIYYFHNDNNPKLYISSADMLTRNLDKRFELLYRVTDKECSHKLMKILGMYFKDTANTFVMTDRGLYKAAKSDDKSIDIHREFIKDSIDKYKFKSMPKIYKQWKK